MNQTKSDVELFWDKTRVHFSDERDWHDLSPYDQIQIAHAINTILKVLY